MLCHVACLCGILNGWFASLHVLQPQSAFSVVEEEKKKEEEEARSKYLMVLIA